MRGANRWRMLLTVLIGVATLTCTTTSLPRVEREPLGKGLAVDGFDYCQDGTDPCSQPAVRAGEVWCQRIAACTTIPGCDCRLFKDDKRVPGRDWQHEVDGGNKVPHDSNFLYACWCTKPAP